MENIIALPNDATNGVKKIDWRSMIAAWKSSGLTRKEFCEQHQLNHNQFLYQRVKYDQKRGHPPEWLSVQQREKTIRFTHNGCHPDGDWISIKNSPRSSIINSRQCGCPYLKNIIGFYERKHMLTIPAETPIYIYTAAVDMRKQINGLVNLLVESFDQNPQQGGLFVFTNSQRKKLKILFWDKNGFVLYYKRLEKSRFQYSKYLQGDKIIVNTHQLKALLMGLDFYLLGEYSVEQYTDFF